MAGRFDHLAPWPLIGRDEELALIRRLLGGGSSGVLVTGPAGTGKSRLASEARSVLTARGRATRMIRCTRATQEIPYAALAALVPTGDDPLDRAPSGGDRFSEILGVLRSQPAGLVLCIDDIDRLDRRSMAVVQQAISETLVSVLATARSDSTVDADIVALWKDLDVTRVEIQALSRDEVAAMVAGGLGGSIDAVALKSIWTTSAGVPLYVRELVVEALARGVLVRERDVWTLIGALPNPATLVELVGLRLAHVSAGTRIAAELIGVAELLPTGLLVDMSSASAVADLEQAGIIQNLDGSHRIAHPLFGDVIRQAMPSVRLGSVMAQLADAIEDRGLDGDDDLIRVAAWRLESGSGGTPAVMNDAAHAAYRAGDFELARRLARAASEHGELEGALLLGQILHETGDHDAAEQVNLEIADILAGASSGSEPAREAIVHRAVVQRAVNLFFGLGRGRQALDVLAGDPDGAPFNRAWFLLNMARLDDARRNVPPDHLDRRSVLVTSAWIDALGGDPDSAIAVLDRLAGEGQRTSLAPSRFRDFPTIPHALGLIEAGRSNEALEVADRGHAMSVEHHPDFIRAWWLFVLARAHADGGRVATAASLFQQGAALQARLNQPGLMRWFLGGAAYSLGQTASTDEADRILASAELVPERDEQMFGFLVDGARCWRRWRRGDHRGAITELIIVGDQVAETGSIAAARRLWFDAARLGGSWAVEDRLESGDTELDRARHGFVTGITAGDCDQMEAAAHGFDRLGAHLWAAEAWTAASRLAADAGDSRRANATKRSALGARARCDVVDTPGLILEHAVTPLTDREREVVMMAARGIASREIADQLFVSLRTVNNLIQRAYVKLGVSSRADAAAALGIDPHP